MLIVRWKFLRPNFIKKNRRSNGYVAISNILQEHDFVEVYKTFSLWPLIVWIFWILLILLICITYLMIVITFFRWFTLQPRFHMLCCSYSSSKDLHWMGLMMAWSFSLFHEYESFCHFSELYLGSYQISIMKHFVEKS